VAPSYPLLQKGEEGIRLENRPVQSAPVEKPTTTKISDQPEYRIQIGVFRNTPNAELLSKIPAVTNILVTETETRKYFTGSWTKYADAQAVVPTIREAGFPGAFIVAFDNNEPIPLDKAKEMEQN
jgi:hypothetical protein